ncbi:DUF732 domain-containing protein [Mycobacterium pseudokansasii]|uniref:DUF732 domain-containing protein n=1 Tax=Mycobacterium pseudokansasii TaxID=2341080 RepID=UPI0007B53E23|nr:DUF732 domain-containing protein [Mycobacterium pseudokansasii]KZS65310.1 hypothetical protein A4G27_02415 [Mycobacterium kansasii]VAZ96724.1 hypothetical protein LAUMK35_03451 [Mycobacterium pseudokansasii]VAZ98167.1 hypothetical protein LAUMK21_03448 [Mycobacterium pseudokansasii]
MPIRPTLRSVDNPFAVWTFAGAVLAWLTTAALAPNAHADTVAYLVNVTMRPGYNFANADAALEYGNRLCNRASQGRGYADVIADVKTDFSTVDEYQASYLVSVAVNELCPALIWQLRNSAANYRAIARND